MTTPTLDPDFSPYKGLQPYTENDRAYFFGRERDQEIIIANLYAASLTVLYGASGVGKSSVLMAGVAPQLRVTPRLALVVYRDWQDAAFLFALKKATLASVSQSAGQQIDVDTDLPFDDFLLKCKRAFGGSLFFILDQFEEYFLYHPISPADAEADPARENFDATLARAVNREDIDANFLFSMRDDGLSKLDRFRGRIPNLLNNMLRLEHLDLEAAKSAILSPLVEYNKKAGAAGAMSVEDELVEALLKDLKTGKVTLNLSGQGKGSAQPRNDLANARIETPYLQMVLMRLWDEEKKEGSKRLRLETYGRLGRAENIVRTHLDKVMETGKLRPHHATAASIFHFLVTPTGQKIAHTPGDLVSYSKQPADEVTSVLNLLSLPDLRILRPIAPPPEQPTMLRYEIFHDVLAPAVLDWCARYTKEQAAAAAKAIAELEAAAAKAAAEQEAAEAKAAAERKLAQERAEAEARAAEQQRQLEVAQKEAASAKLLRRLVYVSAGFLLLALVGLGFGGYALRRAWRSEAKLEKEKDKAEDAKVSAEQQLSRKLTADNAVVIELPTGTPDPAATPVQTTAISPVTDDMLRQIMPNVPAEKRGLYLPYIQKAMAEFNIDTPLRQAAFLAQLAYESGEFRFMEDISSGNAYEGRKDLGNIQPGDGSRFKGRGAFQIVGRANYQRYGDLLGLDLLNNPELAAQPNVTFRTAGLFWKSNGLNELADRQDFKGITRRINGGYNGLDDRLKYYTRAKQVLGVSGGDGQAAND